MSSNSGAVNVALLADNGSDGANQIIGAMEELSNAAVTMTENVMDISEQVKSMGEAVDTISARTEALVNLIIDIASKTLCSIVSMGIKCVIIIYRKLRIDFCLIRW